MFGRKRKPRWRIRPHEIDDNLWILEHWTWGLGWMYERSFEGPDAQERATEAAQKAEERERRGEVYEI